MLVASGGCLFRFCDQYFSGNGSCLWRFGIKNTVDKKEELETLTGSLSYGNGLVLPFYLAARFGVEAVKYAFMAVFALMISGKIKNLFVLVSTPALFIMQASL